MQQRGFLFLQGLASPLFTRLGDSLRAQGHAVYRVNFCAGDWALWAGRPAWNWRGPLHRLPEFLESKFLAAKMSAHPITDVILFGSHRPIHQRAIGVCRAHGARIHVFEEGYVRPNWITVERGGANGLSALPRDPRWYLDVDAALPRQDGGLPMRVPLWLRAAQDIAYRLSNIVNPLAFAGYRTHRPFAAPVEYAGWVWRYARMPWFESTDRRLIDDLLARKVRYFLLPLQLNGDAQIVHHSPFRGIGEVIESVLRSFASHAPQDTEILIKNHPLDTGLHGYQRQIARLSKTLDLRDRVHFIETGHLPTLLEHARGAVVVNSTVGMSALSQNCPTQTLGRPIYDLPGLTSGGSLDQFWSQPEPPERKLFLAFLNTVIHATQVNGDFFTRAGVALAVAGCERMFGELSPLEELLRRHGVPRPVPA